MRSVTLVVPLEEEEGALKSALANLGHSPLPLLVGRLDCCWFEDLNLLLAVGGHGKTQFGIQTQHILENGPPPDLLICGGASGSLVEHVGVGDLVIATDIVEHDYTLKFARRPLPRFSSHPPTLEELRLHLGKTNHTFRVVFGTIASGDEDVIDSVRAEELALKTGAVCVAWEGAGAARACVFNGVPHVEIRCVSDSANKIAPQEYNRNLGLCMANLAALLNAWLPNRQF